MTTRPANTAPILFVADAGADLGVGHAMRLLALAQELLARGTQVHLAGALGVPWVATAYAEAGVVVHAPPLRPADLAALADDLGARVCVLDRYDLGPEWGAALRAQGFAVMTMVDGFFSAHQEADLYVDQNPGAAPRPVAGTQQALAGADYTLFRDDVLALRRTVTPLEPGARTGAGGTDQPSALRVLGVFGGTDPFGAAPVVAPLVVRAAAQAGVDVDLTVVTGDDGWAPAVAARLPQGSTLACTGPVSDLAARAAACDLVVTASGSSVWELLCLGVPIGVVCVADNQTPGYDMVVSGDLAVGVGHLSALRETAGAAAQAVHALAAALASEESRTQRAARGQALLDGQGRRRVADALLALAR